MSVDDNFNGSTIAFLKYLETHNEDMSLSYGKLKSVFTYISYVTTIITTYDSLHYLNYLLHKYLMDIVRDAVFYTWRTYVQIHVLQDSWDFERGKDALRLCTEYIQTKAWWYRVVVNNSRLRRMIYEAVQYYKVYKIRKRIRKARPFRLK